MLFRFAKQNTAKSRFLEIAEYNGITMITELMMMLMITMIKIRSLNKKSWYTMAYYVYTCMLAYDCIPFWFLPKLCERKFKLKIGIAKYLWRRYLCVYSKCIYGVDIKSDTYLLTTCLRELYFSRLCPHMEWIKNQHIIIYRSMPSLSLIIKIKHGKWYQWIYPFYTRAKISRRWLADSSKSYSVRLRLRSWAPREKHHGNLSSQRPRNCMMS